MMNEALTGARSYGAETELWTTAGKELKPCDACQYCFNNEGECHIKDDMQALYPKIISADGIIFGSPAYYRFITAQAKIVMDRMYGLVYMDKLVNKVAGVISVAAGRGHEGVWAPFNSFIQFRRMIATDHAYGFAGKKGEIRKDRYGMKSSEELGKMVASVVKQKYNWPEEYSKPLYRVLRDNYGISLIERDKQS
jgi:multimeric flavodoxin WrbA